MVNFAGSIDSFSTLHGHRPEIGTLARFPRFTIGANDLVAGAYEASEIGAPTWIGRLRSSLPPSPSRRSSPKGGTSRLSLAVAVRWPRTAKLGLSCAAIRTA